MIHRLLDVSCIMFWFWLWICLGFFVCLFVWTYAIEQGFVKFSVLLKAIKIVYLLSVFDLLSLYKKNGILFLNSLIYPTNIQWVYTMSGIMLGALKVLRFSDEMFLWGHCFNICQPLVLCVISPWKYIPLYWNICFPSIYIFIEITLYHGMYVVYDSCHK